MTYLGKVRFQGKIYEGEHEAILDDYLGDRVRKQLAANRIQMGSKQRAQHPGLLKGLLVCGGGGCPMYLTYASKLGRVQYPYYVCSQADKLGCDCPSKRLAAQEIERFVLSQVRQVTLDNKLVQEALDEAEETGMASRAELEAERDAAERAQKSAQRRIKQLSRNTKTANPELTVLRKTQAEEDLQKAEQRLAEIEAALAKGEETVRDRDALQTAVMRFDPVWEALGHSERTRFLNLLLERIEFDGREGAVAFHYRDTGIRIPGGQKETRQV